jgi:F0F1-type ATP synthase epsilon subunit
MDDLASLTPPKIATPKSTKPAVGEDGQPIMHVKVYSPFKIYYDEGAHSISAENETGPFDILPRHHNFITLLKASELIVHRLDNSDERIRITGGIMHVKADQVIVFLDV